MIFDEQRASFRNMTTQYTDRMAPAATAPALKPKSAFSNNSALSEPPM
jgi:hypothetical protein